MLTDSIQLYKYLASGSRGGNQSLDIDSLHWLLANYLTERSQFDRLAFTKCCSAVSGFEGLNEIFSMYKCGERARSIHGIWHGVRVAILMLYIKSTAEYFRKTAVISDNTAIWSGLVHDSQRVNDGDDPSHAIRASEMIMALAKNNKSWEGSYDSSAIVLHHDSDLTQLSLPHEMRCATELLKYADGLDRYRLPMKKWWPKQELMPHIDLIKLTGLAQALVLLTEPLVPNNRDTVHNQLEKIIDYFNH